jgi:hypothetical protein
MKVIKKSLKSRNQGFSFFCLLIEGSVKIIMDPDPDPGGQKHKDSTDPDPDPDLEHWLHHVQGSSLGCSNLSDFVLQYLVEAFDVRMHINRKLSRIWGDFFLVLNQLEKHRGRGG